MNHRFSFWPVLAAACLVAPIARAQAGPPPRPRSGNVLAEILQLEEAAQLKRIGGGLVLGLGLAGGIFSGFAFSQLHRGCDALERMTVPDCRDVPGGLILFAAGSGVAIASGMVLLWRAGVDAARAEALRRSFSFVPLDGGAVLLASGTF